MTSSVRTPGLAEVINRAVQLAVANIFVMRTGRIEKFDASTGLADVKPLQKEQVETDSGSAVLSLPVVPNVPVLCLGGGDFVDTFPITKGDECMLIFADRSLDIWFELGGEQDPVDLRRHNLTDGIAIVGLRARSKKLSEWPTDRREIGKQGGPRVALKSDSVHLGVDSGEDATDKVALAPATKQEIQALRDTVYTLVTKFNALQTALVAHGHPSFGAPSPQLTAFTVPAMPPATVGNINATKVYAK